MESINSNNRGCQEAGPSVVSDECKGGVLWRVFCTPYLRSCRTGILQMLIQIQVPLSVFDLSLGKEARNRHGNPQSRPLTANDFGLFFLPAHLPICPQFGLLH